jgi:hypothetical protein
MQRVRGLAFGLLIVALTIGVIAGVVTGIRHIPRPAKKIEWVQSPESVIVQMKDLGGLPQSDVMDRLTVPDFTLYGDGTLVFTRPPKRGQFSRTPLQHATLPSDTVRDLLKSITDTGFFTFSYGQPRLGVYDVPTTYLYANTKDAANAISAYALDTVPPTGTEWNQFRKLREIKARLDTIANDAIASGTATLYTPNAVVLLVQLTPPISGPVPLEWPFADIDLGSIAPESGVGQRRIDGDLALGILNSATPIKGDLFVQRAHGFTVDYRVALPHEDNFPEFEPPATQTP